MGQVGNTGFYRLLTNTELTNYRTISSYLWLGNKNKLKLIPPKTIYLSADGTVGRCIYIPDAGKTITNIHPWNISKIHKDDKAYEDIFVALFLGYLYNKNFYEKTKDKANGGGIKYGHIRRHLKIPNFPDSKQREIARIYYHKVAKNSDLNLDNYFTKEKERNKQLGIFQLNMETFALRERLEEIVDSIVRETPVALNFAY